MKIAINNLPLKTTHKRRGIGYYTSHLLEALKKEEDVKVIEFTNLSEVRDVDVLHYPWFDLFRHTLPIARKFPTVVTVHDVMPLIFRDHYPTGLRGKINLILQRIALASCRQIITDSETSKKDISKYLKIKKENITVVPLAAGPEFKIVTSDTDLMRVKRQYHLPERFLLYVGDANWVKNLPFLIEGFRTLLKMPDLADIKLVLVGGVFLKDVENIDHPELRSLKLVNKLIKQYGLEENIVRPGQVEDLELVIFYNLATVYVQPSVYEGFGLPILQAFACGTPVVSSNKGSLPETGGSSALYFDPENLRHFTSIAKELLESASLRAKLSKLGLNQAAKFSWKKTAGMTLSVYIRAVKK